MMSHLIRSSVFGLTLLGAGALIPPVPGMPITGEAWAKDKVVERVCVMDEGNGRKRPCSAEYKISNPSWRATEYCYTDEGNGHKRPCTVEYKKSHR